MKFKKCGPEHEAPYLFEVDKKWMRSGNDFSELLESIRKEAYLKGFRRGQEEASYGQRMMSGRSTLEKLHQIWQRLHTGVMRMEKMPLTA